MNHFTRYIASICLFFFLLCSASMSAYALSPAEAAKMAAKQSGGKVLKVKATSKDTYKVKTLMPNGQIRHITIRSTATRNNTSTNDQ